MSKFAERFNSASSEKRGLLLNLPRYLTECGNRNALNILLTDLYFIEAKCAAGMIGDFQGDYERATVLWPEGRSEAKKVVERREALSGYVQDLVRFAADTGSQCRARDDVQEVDASRLAESKLPVPPSSVAHRKQKRPCSTSGGTTELAGNYDCLKAFQRFVYTQSHALGTFASYQNFCAQQACNSDPHKTVAEYAERQLKKVKTPYIKLKHPSGSLAGPTRASNRILRTEEASGRCLAMTPDARYLISGGDGQALFVWALDSGQCLAKLRGHPDRIFSAVITADGRLAVSGDWDGWLCSWDLENKRLLKSFRAHDGPVFSVALTPDGRKAFSGGTDRLIRCWNAETGKRICTLKHENLGELRCLATSSDARCLVSGHIWDVDGNRNTVLNLLNVWDVEKKELTRSLWQYQSVTCLDMTPDGRLIVSGDWGGNFALWDLEKEKPLWTAKIADRVEAVAIAHDGMTIVSVGSDGVLSMWDVKSQHCFSSFDTLHFGSVGSIAISADCARAVTLASDDSMIKLWDLEWCEKPARAEGHSDEVNDVFMDVRRNQVMSRGRDGSLCMWDLDSVKVIRKLDVDIDVSPSVSMDLQNVLVAWANRGKGLFLCDYGSDEGLCRLDRSEMSWYTAARITPDGSRIVAAKMGGVVEVWNSRTHKQSANYHRNLHSGCSVDISPEGRFALTNVGSIWRVLDLASGKILGSNLNLPISTNSPDGRLAFSTRDSNELCIYDLKTMTCVTTLAGDSNWFYRIQFGPSGRKIAFTESTLGAAALHFWDWRNGAPFRSCEKHDGPVTGLAFTPDGLHVVSASTDKTLRVWSAETGHCCIVSYDVAGFRCLSKIHPNGFFAVGTESGRINILELKNVRRELPFVTAVRLWRFGAGETPGQWDENLTAVCPWCNCRIIVRAEVAAAITDIEKASGLSPVDAPCLCLPSDAWQEKRLISACPNCQQQIRYNPFVIDNRDGYLSGSVRDKRAKREGATVSTAVMSPSCVICGRNKRILRIHLYDGRAVHAECLTGHGDLQDSVMFVNEGHAEKCSFCGQQCKGGAVKMPVGWVCLCCYQGSFEMISNSIDLNAWSHKDLVSAISSIAKMGDRLTVLWRFDEVMALLRDSTANESLAFRASLVENLGYVEENPLANEVRQLALNACIHIGKEMVPILLDTRMDEPWQLYANTLLALGSIEPENTRFRRLLEKASKDPMSEIRMRVPMSIDHHETEWTRQLIEGMLFDPDPEVSAQAFEVVDSWDIAAGAMKK